MAGKTTLVNSLLEIFRPPIDPKDRTPGIEIHICKIHGVGKGTTWDFGAQSTFHGAHGLFFEQSNTMFSLVLPIRKGEKLTPDVVCRLLEKGRFWYAFAKASLRPLSIHLKSLIRLLVIFNLIGFTDEAEVEASFSLKEIAERLRKDFKDVFEISHMIEMDCSKSQSDRMRDCRGKLRVVREKILEVISNCATYVCFLYVRMQEADDVPKLCHTIEEHLSLPDAQRKRSLGCFLTSEEFEKWVAEEVGLHGP